MNATRVLMGFFVLVAVLTLPVTAQAASHTVSPGESLYLISQNYGISLNNLMTSNGIQSSLIYPGQKLYIPDSAAGGYMYTVKAGDSIFQIARRTGVNYQDIIKQNGLYNPDLIYTGSNLYIPPASSGGSGQGRSGITPQDLDLLARLITAEADAEPYVGKVAVGAVVLNRVRSSTFPNSIRSVIYQYEDGTYQFEPVMNGWINRPATPDCIRAAKDAVNGWDPTNGAVYFFATYVTNKWLWSRPLSTIIGGVAFTY
ncbi:MAG: cell wall hydrolase [Pelotomaculaceae bacterium]|jgi:N-acetylmuramoyl-L-alanine amidase|nr:LysM peptidoglycan-binding domain-containing protein [Bacillota bacterium]HHU85418.1 LysM peptidoglycan-binding domain-containing protein [Peptococcaceae bacterium]